MSDPPGALRRAAGITTLAAAAFMIAASVLFVVASGGAESLANPAKLLGISSTRIEALRWGALADTFGFYLLMIPMFLTVGDDLSRRNPALARLSALGGISYSLLGATAAIVLAYAGPPLLRAFAAAQPGHADGIALTFTTLVTTIYRGIWQTLELIPVAVWAIGTGLLVWERHRALATAAVTGGVGALLVALARMLQLPDAALAAVLPLAALYPISQVWLGALLFRGSRLD